MADQKDSSPGTRDGDTRDATLINAFTAALRERGVGRTLRSDLAGFYAAHGLAGAELETMVERGAGRLLMYRNMVQGRLRRVIRELMPRTIARLDERRYRADFADFFASAGSHTVILRDVALEFLDSRRELWLRADDVPDYLIDLARHELMAIAVRNAKGGGEAPTGHPLALDRPLRVDGSARLQRYDYAVHQLPLDIDDRTVPEANPNGILAYRDRETYAVRYIALTGRATEVLERLLAGATVLTALQQGAAAAGTALDDDFLAGMTHLFADLSDRLVLLGADTTAQPDPTGPAPD